MQRTGTGTDTGTDTGTIPQLDMCMNLGQSKDNVDIRQYNDIDMNQWAIAVCSIRVNSTRSFHIRHPHNLCVERGNDTCGKRQERLPRTFGTTGEGRNNQPSRAGLPAVAVERNTSIM